MRRCCRISCSHRKKVRRSYLSNLPGQASSSSPLPQRRSLGSCSRRLVHVCQPLAKLVKPNKIIEEPRFSSSHLSCSYFLADEISIFVHHSSVQILATCSVSPKSDGSSIFDRCAVQMTCVRCIRAQGSAAICLCLWLAGRFDLDFNDKENAH